MVRELSAHEVKALHYELLLKDIISTAEKLPPFPDIVWKVMPLIRKMAPVEEIESVIKYDQAITARVLTLSQSAYYGRRHTVSSLQDAILILGGQKLIQVIMIACASRYFQGNVSGYNLNERQLWEHSVASALMGERVARRLRQKRVLTIYTASLLHDIGKTVMDLYARIYLHSSLSEIRKDGPQSIDAERKTLGICHQELGEIIARRWQFPSEVAVAIGHHHSPLKAKTDQDIVKVVYVADQLVNAFNQDEEEGGGAGDAIDIEQDPVFRELGITLVVAGDLYEQIKEDLDGIKQFLKNE